jgi:hypothetical protein
MLNGMGALGDFPVDETTTIRRSRADRCLFSISVQQYHMFATHTDFVKYE